MIILDLTSHHLRFTEKNFYDTFIRLNLFKHLQKLLNTSHDNICNSKIDMVLKPSLMNLEKSVLGMTVRLPYIVVIYKI